MKKKLHWTQRPGGKAKARAAAKKGHKTKKAGKGTRAERAVKKAASETSAVTKLDVLVFRREELHADVLNYLQGRRNTDDPEDVEAADARLATTVFLRYLRKEINALAGK
jgi:hypothetical protein